MESNDKTRVLIAEDDYLVSEAIKSILKTVDFEVVGTASDGQEAIEMACSMKPDVVLMDINMPEINGLEATRQIQERCPMPVVILTAHESTEFVNKANEVGVVAYLTKPLKPAEIKRAITIAVSRHRNLMELRQLTNRLQVSEEKLRSTLASLDDFVFSLNPSGTFTEYYQPPSRRFIVPPESFIGKSFEEVLPLHLAHLLEEAIELAIKTDTTQQFEFSLIQDGEEQWFNAKISNRKDAGNEVCGTTIVVRDISESKLVEEQRLQLALEQERTQILANFIRQASHEFRTPLSVIKANAYLLKQLADSEKQEQRAEVIEEHVEHIAQLVKNMTTLSKLDSGEQELAFEEVELNAIIRAVYQTLHSFGQEKQHEIILDLSHQPISVLGDFASLQQALTHILENAIRYTPANGEITIHTDCGDDYAVITITDTGIGIDEDALPRIFERFYREDVAGTTRGFGLGLSIAKAIIDKHQGRIEAHSELGTGSVFSILLPVMS